MITVDRVEGPAPGQDFASTLTVDRVSTGQPRAALDGRDVTALLVCMPVVEVMHRMVTAVLRVRAEHVAVELWETRMFQRGAVTIDGQVCLLAPEPVVYLGDDGQPTLSSKATQALIRLELREAVIR